ncbi:UDP-N-acetylmuramate dehydrogenase [Woeseiaceae bacterium]|nr:UDP-N-acetylmuramate dehydrogenase [Woeseiaceae bacterium]MDB2544892.1 UDP-N-acetylmuramate dehydrogenase [Woeseiaceae bacterium]
MLVPINSIRGELIDSEPMKKHTSLRVGGAAEYFYKPSDLDDLAYFLSALSGNISIFWLGRGSNILVRDKGLSGVVISSSKILREIRGINGLTIEVEANVPCTMLAKKCIRWGLGPSEFFSGIPGSFGGALAMNAGAYGNETWERVISVKTIDRDGKIKNRNKEEYQIDYREVKGPINEWFISAILKFESNVIASMDRQKKMLEQRKLSQPLGQPSCGSVFRNPPGNFAAKLIEQSNLKGYRIGGAHVSSKHANFIITDERACAKDVEQLIEHIKTIVKKLHDISLICEVKIIGNL